MVRLIRLSASAALLASIIWLNAKPGYAPAATVLGPLTTLGLTWLTEKYNGHRAQQRQSVSENSIGLQAGGDMKTGDIQRDKYVK